MAKIPFSKLGIKIDTQTSNITWEEYNIEVHKYLPAMEKADLISRVINASVDTNGFYNPLRVKINLSLEIVYAYTNLNFTEKQKENELKFSSNPKNLSHNFTSFSKKAGAVTK